MTPRDKEWWRALALFLAIVLISGLVAVLVNHTMPTTLLEQSVYFYPPKYVVRAINPVLWDDGKTQSFHIPLYVVQAGPEDPDHLSYEDAVRDLGWKMGVISQACPVSYSKGVENGRGVLHSDSLRSNRISLGCWDRIHDYTGEWPTDHLEPAVVAELRKYHLPAALTNETYLISDDGRVLGRFLNPIRMEDFLSACGQAMVAEYQATPGAFFLLSSTLEGDRLLYENGVVNPPILRNFCTTHGLRRMEQKPGWVQISQTNPDEWLLTIHDVAYETACKAKPAKCAEVYTGTVAARFRNDGEAGYTVTLVGKDHYGEDRSVTIPHGGLVMVSRTPASPGDKAVAFFVQVTGGGDLIWSAPLERGSPFTGPYTLLLSPMLDGVDPFFGVNADPPPYWLEDDRAVHSQVALP